MNQSMLEYMEFGKVLAECDYTHYSSVPNRLACMFISGKSCLVTSIKDERQTLSEINMHACLFGTLEYEKN